MRPAFSTPQFFPLLFFPNGVNLRKTNYVRVCFRFTFVFLISQKSNNESVKWKNTSHIMRIFNEDCGNLLQKICKWHNPRRSWPNANSKYVRKQIKFQLPCSNALLSACICVNFTSSIRLLVYYGSKTTKNNKNLNLMAFITFKLVPHSLITGKNIPIAFSYFETDSNSSKYAIYSLWLHVGTNCSIQMLEIHNFSTKILDVRTITGNNIL